ncbi:MAG: Ig-like domain-containing protein [Bryobacteraceae bacterium]|nr:Ig-like domain-containing protein [Bryobacteraceae bacterium]
MQRCAFACLLLSAGVYLHAADFYVSPDGAADSPGTIDRPWRIADALSQPAVLKPGDTIWLRGGAYGETGRPLESQLRGTEGEPVTMRQYPGERATLAGGLVIRGANARYWGFEIFESERAMEGEPARGIELIHLVIHARGDHMATQGEPHGVLWYDAEGNAHFTDTGVMSRFERGRANIVARRSAASGLLEFDASGLLAPGDAYELVDANHSFGPPVADGVFRGGRLMVPGDGETRHLILRPATKALRERAVGVVSFLGTDTGTQGAWRGVYGQDGNYIAYHSYGWPSYTSVTSNAADVVLLSNTSTDPRGLQRFLGDPNQRVLSYAHTISSMDLIIPANDNQTHRVALYFCDYQNLGRTITVSAVDTATQTVLDQRVLANFSNGIYLVYNYSGTVSFRVTNNLNTPQALTATAVISGIFWGGTGIPVVDTTAPNVSISSPANNATVQGTVALNANASDNVAVVGVQFLVDGVPFGAEDTTAGYSINWNTIGVANGTHTIGATARDAAGMTGTATLVTVNVNNPPPDNTLPSATINSPVAGPVNGIVTISVNAEDNVAVAGLQLKLDGVNLGSELSGAGPVFTYQWNTALHSNGAHVLSAVARDSSGNLSPAAIVNLTLNNPDVTPPSAGFTNPTNGGVVSQTVTISATASDNMAVVGVQFKLDGNNLGTEILSPPYQFSWNTTGVSDGSHTLAVVARDAAGLTATATITVTVNNTSATFATFLGRDDTTQGNWKGVYGQDGNLEVLHSNLYPSYSNVGSTGVNQLLLDTYSTDPRALLKQFPQFSANERIKAQFYSRFNFELRINTSDNQPHRIALYFCDYDNMGRSITVSMRDTGTGQILDSRLLNNYQNGVYFVYNYRGNVTIRVQNNNEPNLPNGTISGLFWGGSGLPGAPDTTPPTVNLTSPANGAMVANTVNAAATASDNIGVVGVQFKLDGNNLGAEITGAGPYQIAWNTLGVANGAHTLSAVARDAAGLSSTSSVNVTVNNFVDADPPSINFTSPANNSTVLGTIPLQVNAGDNLGVVGVQYRIDGANLGGEVTASPFSNSWNTTAVSNGPHTVTATARDAAGLTSVASITVTVNNFVDTIPPQIGFNAPANNAVVTNTIPLQVTASDNVAVLGVQYKIDGVNLGAEVTAAPFSSSWNTTAIGNGVHTISAVARDAAGLTGTASVTVTVNNFVDTVAPDVSITNPANSAVLSGTVNLQSNATDNVAVTGVQYQIDGVNFGAEQTVAPYTLAWNTTTIGNGPHTITARARDGAGLIGTNTINITVNNVAPAGATVTFLGTDTTTRGNWKGVYGQEGNMIVQNSSQYASYAGYTARNLGTQLYQFYSSDPRALIKQVFQFSPTERIAAFAYSSPTGEMDMQTSDNQTHRVALYFCDYLNAGHNMTVQVLDRTTGGILDTRVLSSYINGIYLVYTYRGPITFRFINNRTGTGTLATVSAVFWGGTGLPGVTDTTPPEGSFTAPANSATVAGTVNLTVNATDNVSVAGVQFKLDGNNLGAEVTGAGPNYNYSWNTVGVANGPHTLSAVVRDGAGLTTTPSINVTVNNFVDTVPPTINFVAPANGATLSGNVALQVNAGDNVAVVGVQYKIDGVNLGAESTTPPFASAWNTASIGNGAHVLSAVARDGAGLTATATVSITVNNFVDTVAPTVNFVSPAANATVSGSVSLQSNASDNVAVVGVQYQVDGVNFGAEQTTAPYTLSFNTTTVTNGTHTLTARARDAAGLIGTVTIDITVSNSAPAGPTVTFLGADVNTKGNWKGVYGQDGNMIVQNSNLYPSYAGYAHRNVGTTVVSYYSSDARALQKQAFQFFPTERIAAYFYTGTAMELDMGTSDNQTHRVALYFADYENIGRQITVEIRDRTSGAILDTRVVSNYTGGQYLVYDYRGAVTFRIINNLGPGALGTLSGVFWGGAGLP